MRQAYKVQDIYAIQGRYFRAREAVRKAAPRATAARRAAEIAEGALVKATERFERLAGELKALGVKPDRHSFPHDPARPGWTILDIADEETNHKAQEGEGQAKVYSIKKTETTEPRTVALGRDEAKARIEEHRRGTPGMRGVSSLRCNG